MVRALLIGFVLWVAGAFAAWALCAQAGRLDDAEGRGDDPGGAG
jgi:hypothetical protein